MSERDTRDTAATTRSQNVVHFTERDLDSAARLVAGLLDRSASAEGAPSLLAIAPNPDDALGLAMAVRALRRGERRALTPITSMARGRRLISAGSKAIVGSASELVRLIGESRLSLAQLQTLVLVWPEELLDGEDRATLESLLNEVPRSAERVAVCSTRSTELVSFLERSMWRARTIEHATGTERDTGAPIRVVTAVPPERSRALRSILDTFDPGSTVLITFSDESEAAAHDVSAVLGSEAGLIEVSRGVPTQRFNLGILFEDIPAIEDIANVRSLTDELVALLRPARLGAMQKIATVTPMNWTGALANARSTQDALRDEIRGYAASGTHLAWVPIVEPLLEGLDAVEVAAAAMMMLDRERRKAKKAAGVIAAPPPQVAERPVREERPRGFGDRPKFGDRPRSFGDRPSGPRGERSDRGFSKDRGERPFKPRDDRRGPPRDRGERPRREDAGPRRETRDRGEARGRREDFGGPRREKSDRFERGARRDDIERMPRAARESREWSERGDRLRHSRRGPRRGESE